MTTTEALQLFEPHLTDIKDALANNMLWDISNLYPLTPATGTLKEVREEVRRLEIAQITDGRTRMIKRIVTYLTPINTAQAVGRITDAMIEKAKEVPIEDLYDGKLRHGAGLCPFHNEETPSFTIFKDNRFKCFGCGVSGDPITFYMKMHSKDFKSAVRELNRI